MVQYSLLMNQLTSQKGIVISPVNMESRKAIGVRVGDTVRVWQKIEEKGKTRLQVFEGLVLARKHGNEAGATFTVRRVSGVVGVEKIFPLYSPMIDKIEIIKRSKVRRAKLYHIREKVAREIRRQMRKMKMVDISTSSDIEDKAKEETQKQEAEEAKREAGVDEKTKENTEEEKQEDKKENTGNGIADGKEVAKEEVQEKEGEEKPKKSLE